ncbi:MAG: YbhB/YbcL family Raf kinase inhibitor-like protein [Pseudomonadota bacterium]|nr:YbhB/YbcL family Raf kinase inhibitor-like protein [Pseudomonadota bacterium]
MLEKLPESVGHALINQRAGMENVLYNQLFRRRQTARLEVSSKAFVFNARLPTRFTADGEGLSPPLTWDRGPGEATSAALIVEDADSPTPHPLVHAIVVGLPGTGGSLDEGALSIPARLAAGMHSGQNSLFRQGWLPPDPPRGHGEHRYVFQVFALAAGDPFSDAPGRREIIDAVLERAIGVGCLIGTYERTERATVEPKETAAFGWTPDVSAG